MNFAVASNLSMPNCLSTRFSKFSEISENQAINFQKHSQNFVRVWQGLIKYSIIQMIRMDLNMDDPYGWSICIIHMDDPYGSSIWMLHMDDMYHPGAGQRPARCCLPEYINKAKQILQISIKHWLSLASHV